MKLTRKPDEMPRPHAWHGTPSAELRRRAPEFEERRARAVTRGMSEPLVDDEWEQVLDEAMDSVYGDDLEDL